MVRLRTLFLGLLLAAGGVSGAAAQCSGQPPAGRLCANGAASTAIPSWFTQSAILDRNFGNPSAQGTILNRGPSLWTATPNPVLGKNGTAGGSLTLSGSSTGSAAIGVQAAAGSTTFNLPVGNGALNQVLITDGAGNTSWTTAGAGTVSSVGLSMPGIFTVSGSPVTGTGTLTATLNTQSANAIWAGPTTGVASAPTFRSLVGADLPNPGASSLGGIQSFAAVGSQWIRQISTSGVPTASQPAFTDISGTLAAAQCPNPSASTLGCVQSFAAQASKWINTISTAGVPSATQPNFTDLLGNASLSQLPSISDKSVIGNNSGGSSIPSALSASNVLDFIATTQGDILYRNGSIWTALPPGTNGQVLTTAGASANPSWTTVTGTGTVTSVATNNGLTGGTITTTGTIGLATIATGNALAYTGAGSGVPVATTPSVLLDVIGSTTGDILYRAAGNWTVLAPGTNGQVLTQGASTPSWSNVGTLTNVTIAAGTGIGVSGTCNITTSGTCTIANNGVLSLGGATGALTVTGPLQVVSTALSINGTNTAHGIPIWEGTGALGNTGVGLTGQVLAGVTGADPVYKSGSRILLNTINCTSTTTCSDTTSLTTTYNEYELVFENLTPATSGVTCEIQVLISGVGQSTSYLANVLGFTATTSTPQAQTTFIPCSLNTSVNNTVSEGLSGTVRVYGVLNSGTTHQWTGQTAYHNSGSSATTGASIAGKWESGTTFNGFQVLWSTGGFNATAGGTIKVYGML